MTHPTHPSTVKGEAQGMGTTGRAGWVTIVEKDFPVMIERKLELD
jgi:hypothetical protein